MSVTEFENADELIPPKDINSAIASINSSRCSCVDCDSTGCFEKRKAAVKDHCQCSICRDLRVYSTAPNKDSRDNKADVEPTTKKIIREVVTRETVESLKRVTETMYEIGTNENFAMIRNRPSTPNDNESQQQQTTTKPTPTKSQVSNKPECCKQRPIVEVPNTNANDAGKEDNTTTKLSAQVMNVPYENLHESSPSAHELTEQNPLMKLNIFKRIKEIYEACSCKVCECISSKPKPRDLRDDFCKCKPCQCQDCVKSRKKIEDNIRRIPHSGCPCISCDRKDCQGIAKTPYELQLCDCNPSDNIQYQGNLKRCKCESCQCLNCRLLGFRTSKTVKLGQVDEFIPRDTCQCSPCECIECKQIYNNINPTIMCTPFTSKNNYSNYCRCDNCRKTRCQSGETDICECERYDRAMKKLSEKKFKDYDIRTVIVNNNGPFNQQRERKFKNHSTVALYASLKNRYPNHSCNKRICICNECECLVCSARDNSIRNYRDYLRHDVMSVHNNNKLPMSITNGCKCMPCECEICSRKEEREDNKVLERKCRCDVCDCLNCDDASLANPPCPKSSYARYSNNEIQPMKVLRSMDRNKNCDCNPCNCNNCNKLFSCSSSVKFYSNGKNVERKTQRLRKVLLITPSTSESRFKSRKTNIGSVSSNTLNTKQSIEGVYGQNISTCPAISHNYATINNLSNVNKKQTSQLYQDNKEYNVISDSDVDEEIFFKLNNPVLDSKSFKSIHETPIKNNCSRDFTQTYFKKHKIVNINKDKPNEAKSNDFNIIHEQPDKITSNDFNEPLPVFWTCSNKTSNPNAFSQKINKTCIMARSNLKDKFNVQLKNNHRSDDFNDKDKRKSINQIFKDNDKLKDIDIFTKYIKHSCCDENYIFDNKGLLEEPHKSTSSLNSVIDNQHYKDTVVNHFDATIDYERAIRVLWEAKAFSSKLIKILDSFETANRQFESASQKFKILHESLLDIKENKVNKKYRNNFEKIPESTFGNTFEVKSETPLGNEQPKDESVKNENEAEREYEQSTSKTEEICNNFQKTEQLIHTNYGTPESMKSNEIIEKSGDINIQQTEIDTFNDINIVQKSNSQLLFNKVYSKVEILPSKTSLVQNSDSTNLNVSPANFNKESKSEIENNNVLNIQTPTLALVMNKLDSVFGNITSADKAIATDDVEKNLVEIAKRENIQGWQILKKNLYLNTYPINKRVIFQSPELELDTKEAIQRISFQMMNQSHKFVPRPNEALNNLQNEVSDLLNMPLLQISPQSKYLNEPDKPFFQRSKLNSEFKTVFSTAASQTYDCMIARADKEVSCNINSETKKVSCDQLKANFTGLRRVSDHTVLVKWNVPKRIRDVQGYELLVDGRAVQKIFSPTRTMAVVTCLPHAARVLLTIRTIAAADCGHAPATTIVYRPRTT